MFDYSNLKYIKRIEGNYIFLKDKGAMHCNGLNIETQEDLEIQDKEIGIMLNFMKEKSKK